jgi:hypothetical protein
MSLEKLRRILIKSIVNLAKDELIKRCINDVIVLLKKSEPEEIWDFINKNQSLVKIIPDNYMKKIDAVIKVIKSRGMEKDVISFINNITIEDVLKFLYVKTVKNPKARSNLMFMVSSPTCMKWLRDNIEEIKTFIKQKLE